MTITEDTKDRIQQLQLAEQRLQNTLAQKQNFQVQMNEIDSALEELKGKKKAFKIVGSIMISTEAEQLVSELQQKKEITALRIKNLEKQENKIKETATKLQGEVLQGMKAK